MLKAESGEIALSVDVASRCRKDDTLIFDWLKWTDSYDCIADMKRTSKGVSMLDYNLRQLRDAFENEGRLTKEAIDFVIVGEKGNIYSIQLSEMQSALEENPGNLDPAALLAAHRKEVLDFIQGQLDSLEKLKTRLKERERIEEESRRAAQSLPSREVLEKIMRYEMRLERQLYRAMTQLERLQRMRRGEAVPAPLKVDLAERV